MPTSRRSSNPDLLAAVTPLGLRARQVVDGILSGMHRSPMHGFSVEFAEYREYVPGDDLKRLDWRVFGRSDRFYVKQYEEETNLRATLVVDSSASMRYGDAGSNKFDYAATLATTLAHLLVGQQDAVGLALFDAQPRQILQPVATQAQLARIVEELESAAPDRETDLGPVLHTLAEQLPRRGMVLLISDLLTDLPKLFDGLSQLRYRGHEVIVFQVLHADEMELPFNTSVLFHDIEGDEDVFAEPRAFRKAYRAAMREFITEVESACGARSIDHLLLLTNGDLARTLSHYLHGRTHGGVRTAGMR